MPTTRRIFLERSSGAMLGLSVLPLTSCETQTTIPKGAGIDIPFLTPIDRETSGETGRQEGSFFVQFGGRSRIAPDGGPIDWTTISPQTESEWSLTIDGLVDTDLMIDAANLRARTNETRTIVKTIRCVIDDATAGLPGLIGTGTFTGVPLSAIMADAVVDMSRTRRFRIFSRDEFTNNLTLDEVMDAASLGRLDPMLAWSMNGEPIPHIHGGPIRLIVPSEYGYKQMKWPVRISAVESDDPFGTYQDFGFDDEGTIQQVTKATNPSPLQEIPAGPFVGFGFATSGASPITSVEFSIDDGEFEAATLLTREEVLASEPLLRDTVQFSDSEATYPLKDVWTLFRFDWEATPGEHSLRFRCIDADGNVQEETDRDAADGVTPWWDINVTVV